jgi:hypothetical protein
MTYSHQALTGFGLFFGPNAFFVGIVGHQGFPVSVSDLESIPPLPGVASTTRTKVVSESSRRNAPYPGVTAGDLLGAR